jgi:HSP20 family molecular chaperone IbpA
MTNQPIARVDLPGLERRDVMLQVHQTRLLIAAGAEGAEEMKRHLEGDTHLVYRRDRGTGGFFCALLLPNGVHADRLEATLTNGVLLVTALGEGADA